MKPKIKTKSPIFFPLFLSHGVDSVHQNFIANDNYFFFGLSVVLIANDTPKGGRLSSHILIPTQVLFAHARDLL